LNILEAPFLVEVEKERYCKEQERFVEVAG
jgi:hypothetical protein